MLPQLLVAHKERLSPLDRLTRRLIIFHRDLLVCASAPQPCDKDVVERPSPPVHTDLSPRCCQTSSAVETGKLRPLIPVKNCGGRDGQRVLQGFQTPPHVHRDRPCPREDRAAEPLQDCHQVENPTMPPDVRAIRPPDLMPPYHRDPTESVRGHPRRGMGLTPAGLGRDRLHPHRLPQPRHALVMHVVAWAASPGAHPPSTIIRRVRLWRLAQPHQQAMLWTLPLHRVVGR
jgi:hypothetical protein